ncbi:MAG: hypothetical protein AB1486_17670 [Planctomycetota bacterium]
MKRVLLFVALLASGLGILLLSLGRNEMEEIIAPLPRIELPPADQTPTPIVAIEPEQQRITAENLTKHFTKQVTLADGSTAQVTSYVFKVARGDTEKQRSREPELLIYNGKPPPEERVVVRVTAHEGSIPPSTSPGGAAGSRGASLSGDGLRRDGDSTAMRQIDLRGDVTVSFFDPEGRDDLVLRTEQLTVYPKDPDDPQSELWLYCPLSVSIAKESGTLAIRAASLRANLATRRMTLGGEVEVSGSDFRVPALDALLGTSATHRAETPPAVPAEDVVIKSHGEMTYEPDPPSGSMNGGALTGGMFRFADGVEVRRGEERIRGEKLEMTLGAREDREQTSVPGSQEPDSLTLASFRMTSPPGSRTTLDTATAEGECQVIEWHRADGRLFLAGLPELRLAVASDGHPAKGPAPVPSFLLRTADRIEVIPAEPGTAAENPPIRVRLLGGGSVQDTRGLFALDAEEVEASLTRVAARGSDSPAGRGAVRLESLLAIGGTPTAVLQGMRVQGQQIRLRPAADPSDPPQVEVEGLQELASLPGSHLSAGSAVRIQSLGSARLAFSGTSEIVISGRSRATWEVGSRGASGEPQRVLVSDGLVLPFEETAPTRNLVAAGDVDLVDGAARVHMQGERLELPLAAEANAESSLLLSGKPAHLTQNEGSPEESRLAALEIEIVIAENSVKRLHASHEARLSLPAAQFSSPWFSQGLAQGVSQGVSQGLAQGTPQRRLEPPAERDPLELPPRLTLNAFEVSIYSGADPESGPERLQARGGVALAVSSRGFEVFGRELDLDLVSNSGYVKGDPQALLPAEILWVRTEGSPPDRLEGPRIEFERGGSSVRVPEDGAAYFRVAGDRADERGELLVVACRGEMLLLEDRLQASDTVRAKLEKEGEAYQLRARRATVLLSRDPDTGQIEPRRLIAQGEVGVESAWMRGQGDALVGDAPWGAIVLEGRGRPCWIEKDGGGLLEAAVIDIDYRAEACLARRGTLSARAR